MPIGITPLGLAGNYPDPSPGVTVNLDGAEAKAAATPVSAYDDFTSLGKIMPTVLHMAGYQRLSKISETVINLTGAAIRCQGEELEGANVTIRLAGATLFCNGQDITPASDEKTSTLKTSTRHHYLRHERRIWSRR